MRRTCLIAIMTIGVMPSATLAAAPETGAYQPLALGKTPAFLLDRRPDFIFLEGYGFRISWKAPFDVAYLDDLYYLRDNGTWYRAHDYRGPWKRIDPRHMPVALTSHDWAEIVRARDAEYRRHDPGYWEDRFQRERLEWLEYDHLPGMQPEPSDIIWP